MTKDNTAVARVAKQRVIRKELGWHEVKVWVPTEEDAKFIRDYAQAKRDAVEPSAKQAARLEFESAVEREVKRRLSES